MCIYAAVKHLADPLTLFSIKITSEIQILSAVLSDIPLYSIICKKKKKPHFLVDMVCLFPAPFPK